MKKTLLALPLILNFAACSDGLNSDDLLLENATASAALSIDGETEELAAVPDGDLDDAAEELADAVSADIPEPLRDCSLEALREKVIEAYDEDGDGVLSSTEREVLREDFAPEARRFRQWARYHGLKRLKWVYDANDDDSLDDAERQELRNDLESRCLARQEQLVALHDVDGDGELDDVEWEAAKETIRARLQAKYDEVIAEFDYDADGELSEVERDALKLSRRAYFAAQRAALFGVYDADDSGALEGEERSEAREYCKSWVRGDHFGERFAGVL